MKLKERIQQANTNEDGREVNRIMSILRYRHEMTYAEQAEFFQRCDPRIDAARFEELCQVADEVK